MIKMAQADADVLEAAVTVLTEGLNALVSACLDTAGRPKAPDRGALMRARALLPPKFPHAFHEAQDRKGSA
jgi:hypothetical protein